MTPRRPALAIAALLALTMSCSKETPEDVESETIVPVTTAPAQTGAITATIRASGLVTPAPGAELIVVAPEPARIAAIPKAEGDVVRRGDILVRFEIPSTAADAARQRAEIGRAEARLTSAKSAQARASDLFQRGIASRKEVEEATRDVADAEADLAGARAAATAAETVAGRSVVRATFDGVVAKRSHNPGDLVEAAASDAVLRVIDPRRLEVTASIPIADAPRVRVGAAAHLADTRTGSAAAALKVVSRPAAVEQGAATVPIRLAFTAPSNLPSGSPVLIEIDAETRDGVVVIPSMALVREGEETAVFVAIGDKAERRIVTTGLESHDQVEISTGVKPGDAVIVSGQNGLPDGAKVTTTQHQREADDRAAATDRK